MWSYISIYMTVVNGHWLYLIQILTCPASSMRGPASCCMWLHFRLGSGLRWDLSVFCNYDKIRYNTRLNCTRLSTEQSEIHLNATRVFFWFSGRLPTSTAIISTTESDGDQDLAVSENITCYDKVAYTAVGNSEEEKLKPLVAEKMHA